MEFQLEISFLGATAAIEAVHGYNILTGERTVMVIFAEDDIAAALGIPVPEAWLQRFSIEESTGQLTFEVKPLGQDEADELTFKLTRFR